MKLNKILNEGAAEMAVQRFKNKWPHIKEKMIKLPPYLISHLIKWWGTPEWVDMDEADQSYDYRSIKYRNAIEPKKMTPIIIGKKDGKYVILDGQHRAYSVFIVRKLPRIKALVYDDVDSYWF